MATSFEGPCKLTKDSVVSREEERTIPLHNGVFILQTSDLVRCGDKEVCKSRQHVRGKSWQNAETFHLLARQHRESFS